MPEFSTAPTCHVRRSVFTRGGLVVFAIGVIVLVASLVFNHVTANDGGGANIGAGLGYIAGACIALIGAIVAIIGFVSTKATRSR